MSKLDRPNLSYVSIIVLQAIIALGIALFWALAKGPNAGLSALIGGLICVGPSGLFAFRLWAAGRGEAERAEAGGATAGDGWMFGSRFVVGEALKIVLTIVAFTLVFKLYVGVDALALIVGFIGALQGYFLAFLLQRRSSQHHSSNNQLSL